MAGGVRAFLSSLPSCRVKIRAKELRHSANFVFLQLDTSKYPIVRRDSCAFGMMATDAEVWAALGRRRIGLNRAADAVFRQVDQVAEAVVLSQSSRRML